MITMIEEARQLRPGDTIVRHPDFPDRRVRYRVSRLPLPTGDGAVLIDYTAPAEELPGLTPNNRASGILILDLDQPCQIERGPGRGAR